MEITLKEACTKGFWSCLEPSDWISLIAVGIAMLAAVASWLTILSQERINKKNKEAIIVPGLKTIETTIVNIFSDWDKREVISKNFSKTTLPIWNHGNSPVFNITYLFYIENIDELSKKRYTNNETFIKFEGNDEISVQDITGLKQIRKIIKTKPFLRNIDVIRPYEYGNVFLPNYFIILLNYFFSTLTPESDTNDTPHLLLKLTYDDIDFNTWEVQFRLYISGTYNVKEELNAVEKEIITSIQYETIQFKMKNKRLSKKENDELMKKRNN